MANLLASNAVLHPLSRAMGHGSDSLSPRAWLLRVSLVLALASSLALPIRHGHATVQSEPNIVFILTDDQRWDTLWAMPHVQSDLVAHGIDFRQSFVVNSLCCPSRASILAGQYTHSTGVWDDGGTYGGFHAFNDAETIATRLHDAGYHTGLIGKYLNGYVKKNAGYVPPGWDRWLSLIQSKTSQETAYYYNYNVSDQGLLVYHGNTDADYSTDVFATEADTFIRSTSPDQPVFLYLAPAAPHLPATPPTRYMTAFSDLLPFRPPNYNEADVSDKPLWVQHTHSLRQAQRDSIDAFRIAQYRTLLAVDDAIGTVIQALTDTGRLANTMIVFASDNGYTWGEHRLRGKVVPYEESIRVPLVIRYDPLVANPGTDQHIVTNVDYASTFAELAGASSLGFEGMSLIPLLSQSQVTWRGDFLVDHYSDGTVPSYCAVRNEGFLYVAYTTGEEELYDLTADPYQLVNVAADPGQAATVAALRSRVQGLCFPAPPAYAWAFDALPPSVPTGLAATTPGSTEADLTWAASTDNVAVTGYTIYRDGVQVGSVGGAVTTYADLGITPNTTYVYTVDAIDGAGNGSAQSAPLSVTTPG
jgi:arylsulfatase A-like enzyme